MGDAPCEPLCVDSSCGVKRTPVVTLVLEIAPSVSPSVLAAAIDAAFESAGVSPVANLPVVWQVFTPPRPVTIEDAIDGRRRSLWAQVTSGRFGRQTSEGTSISVAILPYGDSFPAPSAAALAEALRAAGTTASSGADPFCFTGDCHSDEEAFPLYTIIAPVIGVLLLIALVIWKRAKHRATARRHQQEKEMQMRALEGKHDGKPRIFYNDDRVEDLDRALAQLKELGVDAGYLIPAEHVREINELYVRWRNARGEAARLEICAEAEELILENSTPAHTLPQIRETPFLMESQEAQPRSAGQLFARSPVMVPVPSARATLAPLTSHVIPEPTDDGLLDTRARWIYRPCTKSEAASLLQMHGGSTGSFVVTQAGATAGETAVLSFVCNDGGVCHRTIGWDDTRQSLLLDEDHLPGSPPTLDDVIGCLSDPNSSYTGLDNRRVRRSNQQLSTALCRPLAGSDVVWMASMITVAEGEYLLRENAHAPGTWLLRHAGEPGDEEYMLYLKQSPVRVMKYRIKVGDQSATVDGAVLRARDGSLPCSLDDVLAALLRGDAKSLPVPLGRPLIGPPLTKPLQIWRNSETCMPPWVQPFVTRARAFSALEKLADQGYAFVCADVHRASIWHLFHLPQSEIAREAAHVSQVRSEIVASLSLRRKPEHAVISLTPSGAWLLDGKECPPDVQSLEDLLIALQCPWPRMEWTTPLTCLPLALPLNLAWVTREACPVESGTCSVPTLDGEEGGTPAVQYGYAVPGQRLVDVAGGAIDRETGLERPSRMRTNRSRSRSPGANQLRLGGRRHRSVSPTPQRKMRERTTEAVTSESVGVRPAPPQHLPKASLGVPQFTTRVQLEPIGVGLPQEMTMSSSRPIGVRAPQEMPMLSSRPRGRQLAQPHAIQPVALLHDDAQEQSFLGTASSATEAELPGTPQLVRRAEASRPYVQSRVQRGSSQEPPSTINMGAPAVRRPSSAEDSYV
jgi:hypothetical protein